MKTPSDLSHKIVRENNTQAYWVSRRSAAKNAKPTTIMLILHTEQYISITIVVKLECHYVVEV